ncbi:putative quinol monooxygenase [Desulfosporosinus fructosivorans]|uniref:putative quinol monooxygenase n=1 Tax=Desulfosporosinus fructosivorans TaxID=2018669 RepID=UPI001FB147E8|nr:hypothetical protein [Desulfosporosinus fructosivorans]
MSADSESLASGVHRRLARSVLRGAFGKVLFLDSNSLGAYSTSCTVWSRGKSGDHIKALPIAIKVIESLGITGCRALFEKYKDTEAFKAHGISAYFKEAAQKFEDLLEGKIQVKFLEEV